MGFKECWVVLTVFCILTFLTVLGLSLVLNFQSKEDIADGGASSTEETLDTNEPLLTGAYVTIIPEEINVKKFINDSYIVSCRSSDMSSKAEWFNFKNQMIDTSLQNRIRVEMNFGTDLFLYRIRTRDAGVYMCVTPKGVASFNLTVVRPLVFNRHLGVQSAREGQTYKLTCVAMGQYHPKIIWKVDEKEPKAPKYKVTKDSGLIIHNVTEMDAGKHYTCRATDLNSPIPHSKVMNITLKVRVKPRLVNGARSEHWGALVEFANLTCAVHAEPPARFEWTHKNKTLVPSDEIRILNPEENKSILQVFVRNDAMFSEYTCRARNEVGSLQTTMFLTKARKPETLVLELIEVTINAAKIRMKELKSPTGDTRQVNILPIIEYVFQSKISSSDWKYSSYSKIDEDFVVGNFSAGTTYQIRARSKNLASYGDYSEPITVVTATSTL